VAAVLGAILIGRKQAAIAMTQANIADRQARIMERQTLIAERQAATEQTRLRAELYDRRVVVYAGIEQYLAESSTFDAVVNNDVRNGLFKSLSVARFLLGDDVDRIARDIHIASLKLRANMRRLEKVNSESKREEISVLIDQSNDKLHALHMELRETMVKYLSLHSQK
jgi:hypothetical protein